MTQLLYGTGTVSTFSGPNVLRHFVLSIPTVLYSIAQVASRRQVTNMMYYSIFPILLMGKESLALNPDQLMYLDNRSFVVLTVNVAYCCSSRINRCQKQKNKCTLARATTTTTATITDVNGRSAKLSITVLDD